ncbi:MAG: acyl-CoA dehydrogenase family protein [Candidatus Cyclobacteriaceae bacterium M2_1C_046]
MLNQYLQKAYEIALEVTRPEAEKTDAEGIWVGQTMNALKEAKMTGLVVPKEKGGLGFGLTGLVKVSEILGRESGSAGLCFGMHCVGAAVIAAKATKFQQEQFLNPINEGKHITTLAVSEPGSGAHFYFPQTSLTPEGDHYIVNGTKTFITNGNKADSYVISTVGADPEAAPDMFSCLVLPQGTPGMKWKGDWDGIGMRGNNSIGLELDDVYIPKNHLLGEEGQQMWYMFNVVVPYFLMSMSGAYLGIAARALDEAIAHISNRTYSHSGAQLASNNLIQSKIGELWTRVESSRRLIYYAAEQGDIGEEQALPAILSAKADVANCATEVVNEAMTLCGGIAYRESNIFSRLLRDARAAHVMAPTTDMLNIWLGRALLSQPILGD